MLDIDKQTVVEGFILKWTMTAAYTGVLIIFITKVLWLFKIYITSGQMVQDLGTNIIEGIKAFFTLGA